MKRSTFIRLAFGGAVGAGIPAMTPGISRGEPTADVIPTAKDRSLQLEVGHAIEKGLAFLKGKQDASGHWGSTDYPAITGLVLSGFLHQPSREAKAPLPGFVQKGLDFLAGAAKPDGGIYGKELANYNTAVAIMTLFAADPDKYAPIIRKGRAFIIGQQNFYPKKDGKMDPYEGGIGYGDDGPHSDVSNTSFALEALRKTQTMVYGQDTTAAKDLNWAAAVSFLQRCQNQPQFNQQGWVTGDPKNAGGFIYTPVESHAEDVIDGKTVPRSYGSMSYEGMLSYIYADLGRTDPRVTAVFGWLTRNFTVTENPGMGPAGLFYYYHAMAKALTAHGTDGLQLANGKTINWRHELALKLIDLQASEGSWVNAHSGRWWEKDPVLVTSYGVRTLEMIHPDI